MHPGVLAGGGLNECRASKGDPSPMQDKTVSEVIETAIRREEEAYHFYMDIHDKVSDPGTRDILSFVAGEEQRHRAFLVKYRDGKFGAQSLRQSDVVSYHVAEHLDAPEVSEEIKPEDVFLVAAHRESRSHRFYAELAMLHDSGEIREMLLKMANEELKHKEKMEYLYANTAFPQTAGG
jgi:rubrerythrin